MGFFSSMLSSIWAGGRAAPPRAEATPTLAPSTAVSPVSEPALIQRYKQDHQKLLSLFGGVVKSTQAGEPEQALAGLLKLRESLQAHLLHETINFYARMEAVSTVGSPQAKLILSFRLDMNEIAKGVYAFFDRYRSVETVRAQRNQLLCDLEAVGAALQKRIGDEEAVLYPLYVPAA